MKRKEILYNAISGISEGKVADAYEYSNKKEKNTTLMRALKIAGVAAVFCSFIVLSLVLLKISGPNVKNDPDPVSTPVTSNEIVPGIDSFVGNETMPPDTEPIFTGQFSSDPDIYIHPTVEELREMNGIGCLVPVYLTDGYAFAPINLLTVNDEIMLCNAYLIDNRNKVIERAEQEYGTGQMAVNYGNVSFICFNVGKKMNDEILTITAEGSQTEYSETVEIKEDYSKYIGFNDLSPKIIEESRTECFDYDPAMMGYMYEVFLDAGEYTLWYRYVLRGNAEPLSAEELYSVIMSCEYRG